MIRTKALRIAIEALKEKRQKYAFDANLRKRRINDDRQRLSGKEYDILTDAITEIEQMLREEREA